MKAPSAAPARAGGRGGAREKVMGVISWAAQAFGPAVVGAAIVAVLAFVWWLSHRDARAAERRDEARQRGDGRPPPT